MNIGIDIDGVLTNIKKFIIEKGLSYCNENKTGKLINPEEYESNKIFDWDEETDLDFWIKNIYIYAENNPPILGASENIKKLKKDGHKIYIITARWLAGPVTDNENEQSMKSREKMRYTVKEWLRKNSIIYDEIIFSGEDKSKFIKEKNIDIMIEDSPRNLKTLSKVTKMICYDWDYNRGIENENIYRCQNWNDIYNHIKNIK